MRNTVIAGSIFLALLALIVVWRESEFSRGEDPGVISQSGIHWHAELAIYVGGERQEIPSNIGLGVVHQPVHTHEDSHLGILHLEFPGAVRREEVMLGRFFDNWNREMRSFGGNMKMAVNGRENTEYENYVMRDKDKIELWFD